MSDFDNINSMEEYDEYVKNEERRKFFKTLYKILVFAFAGLVGFLIYVLLSMAFDKGPNETELGINSNDVRALYSYVTYGVKGVRGNKFLYSDYVDVNNFSNEEKFYYALQFASEIDFIYDENYNKNNTSGNKIYFLPDSKVKQYMDTFFGKSVVYNSNYNFNYVYNFKVGKNNSARMNYNATQGGFDVVFDTYVNGEFHPSLQDYYTYLYQAVRLDDGTIKLREKIVYLTNEKGADGSYIIYIYKDMGKTVLLGQMHGVSENVFNYGTIDFSTLENTSYIEYTFGLDGVNYYFKNSRIVNE